MQREAERLAEYARDRVGEALRDVGYHTSKTYGIIYLRDDVTRIYPADRLERFIRASRRSNRQIDSLDEMGARASLHSLAEGFIIQFHRGRERVIFLAIDKEIGRQLSRFIDDCLAQLD